MRRTALAALCLAAVAGAGLTGCLPGEDKASKTSRQSEEVKDSKEGEGPFAGLTGGEITERALDATTGASSLRMQGDVPDEASGGTLHIDMALDKKGDCAGTMGMGDEGEAELIKTGDTLYLKYDEAFLRAQSKGEPKADVDAAVEMLAGKWTKMSATGADADEIAGFCDLDEVLGDAKDGGSDATRGRATTVDGTPAIVLNERDGKDRYTFYVATEGKPYLLRIDSTSAADPGSITFTDYEKPVPAEEPEGEILDLDALS
ncbi:hypothetical protein N4P33_17755 [Streptomyces sp. 15-116A]|uniref:hypothetical protein n=1 Tax=Streptomyces sp. 15-116A TaxID=2259035 RepID=UPI0021B28ACA|nr:hypothetical protein [Streptomyces sp. 15-116A]MCT7353989.1 hypothetical protein [Streptomyces sp. 15-116A]